jgi:hypothetical protein
MEIRIGGSEPALTQVKPERRDHERSVESERQVSPGVIVEIGRSVESAGTYTSRGILDVPLAKSADAATPGSAPATGQRTPSVRADAAATALASTSVPETLTVQANAHVHALVSASPAVAVAARAGVPAGTNLQSPPADLLAGIQTLASNALKQAEKGNAAAEHEDETDPLRQEKDPPARAPRKRRG